MLMHPCTIDHAPVENSLFFPIRMRRIISNFIMFQIAKCFEFIFVRKFRKKSNLSTARDSELVHTAESRRPNK